MSKLWANISTRFTRSLKMPDHRHVYRDIAVVGKMSTTVLQALNFKGQPCKEPIQSSECELNYQASKNEAV